MIVEFNPDEFITRNPQFKDKLTNEQLISAFEIACLMCDNSDSSFIPYDPAKGIFNRKTMLYLLVCHLCVLALRPFDQAGPTVSASQGSVNVSFQVPNVAGGEYFNQTPCGATYYQLLKQCSKGGFLFTYDTYHPYA